MTDVKEIVTALRQTPANMLGTSLEEHYWNCHKAADLILRLNQQVIDMRAAESRVVFKNERNRTIYLRVKSGERNKDLANEYGISCPAISKICQRERDKERLSR